MNLRTILHTASDHVVLWWHRRGAKQLDDILSQVVPGVEKTLAELWATVSPIALRLVAEIATGALAAPNGKTAAFRDAFLSQTGLALRTRFVDWLQAQAVMTLQAQPGDDDAARGAALLEGLR